MKPQQFDKLPQCFKDKIKIDEVVEEMKKDKVIEFTVGRKLILRQQTARLQCIQLLKKNKTGNAA